MNPDIQTYLTRDCGYLSPRLLPCGRAACIMPLLFTAAIVTIDLAHLGEYADRWCYLSKEAEQAALDAWDGRGEPQGWHRHPRTGRRRTGSDPLAEYINH